MFCIRDVVFVLLLLWDLQVLQFPNGFLILELWISIVSFLSVFGDMIEDAQRYK